MPGLIKKTTKIAVLCGGFSSEREVSLRSGQNCLEALHRLGYQQAVLMEMTRSVALDLHHQGIELVFLALHGRYGEDGCIQGLLEIMGIPYTGNRLTASAIAMDKELTKKVLQSAGLPVIPSVTVKQNGTFQGDKAALAALKFPVMVKPVLEGSSVGMSKVDERERLDEAVKIAATFGDRIMVEEFVPGKAITVGVFHHGGKPVVTPILELRTKTAWYDWKAKYTEGMTEFILPADIPENVTQAIQETTLQAHQAIGCYGLSRVDFVVDEQNRFYLLEVNTIPGMTNLSDLPAQAKCMGVDYDTLVECILETAADFQHAL